jgi:ATP-dependent 26S proteasome regulatory subunit
MILATVRRIIQGKTPLVYLVSEEEERVERIVLTAAEKVANPPWPVYVWSCINGLTRGKERVDECVDPVAALALFLRIKAPALLIFKDLHLFLHDNPSLTRQLKEANRVLRLGPKKIFFVCPRVDLPGDLFSLFKIEDVPLPQYEELSRILDLCIRDRRSATETLQQSLTQDLRDKMVRAAMGFTANEAADVFHGSLMNQTQITSATVDNVLEEKGVLVRKSGVLEFVSTQAATWEIGGLENLKKWLRERSGAFAPDAEKQGLNAPKGILVMGVSGCGKSLCVKAVASFWRLPLLRLDMGRIYDGLAGPPEEAMRKAIKTSEALAPCVLWIDEIEAGIANQQQKQAGGNEARVLALFLTWMQEKTAPVFVGATANEVEVLPPEILRKGRFDELFYMGLPGKEERRQILEIHMKKRHVDPALLDMDYLAASTDGLNGAEIEQGVVNALFEAKAEATGMTEHILANTLRNIVPLSRTMRERIQKIEAWARDRAMNASFEAL